MVACSSSGRGVLDSLMGCSAEVERAAASSDRWYPALGYDIRLIDLSALARHLLVAYLILVTVSWMTRFAKVAETLTMGTDVNDWAER